MNVKYILYIAFIIATWSLVYFFSQETLAEKIESDNREILQKFSQEQEDCYRKATSSWTSREISQKLHECSVRPLPELYRLEIPRDRDNGSGKINNAKATTGSVIPEPPKKWYTAKHTLILTGSHDYRIYSDRKWAVWKNNNPSWLTWWISPTLKAIWKENWIEYERWTLRPINEWWNYIRFSSIEHGLRAKVISIRDRWWKATVEHFLAWWGTDHVNLSFPTDKIISELTEEEFAELFIQQLKKESPWLVSQLVQDNILKIQ